MSARAPIIRFDDPLVLIEETRFVNWLRPRIRGDVADRFALPRRYGGTQGVHKHIPDRHRSVRLVRPFTLKHLIAIDVRNQLVCGG
jgi:hypothetical protein